MILLGVCAGWADVEGGKWDYLVSLGDWGYIL